MYIYNDEKKIRVCDNCFNTLKKKEVDHSFYNHSLAKYTDAVEKGLSKMLNDAPYIPIVVPEEQQQKKYTASVTPIPEKPDNDEESKIEIRSESVYDNRRDRKNLSVTSEYLSKITPSDKRILLIFDKELIFAQDPIIYSIENDIKHDTTILPLSECEDLTFDDRYRLVLVFINHWRHVTEETEKLCQKIYNIYRKALIWD